MPADSISPLRPLPDNDEILIPSRQMPAYVGLSVQTLARWRHEGKGPEYVKIGRLIAYKAGIVRGWLDACRLSSTSSPTQ
ncbi:DNA-binding protein [Nitratireductor aquimarinus]|uniref:helix-turn-helix transcriptional regulator n=1 Tax=Nitratireductor aquimarinus TaxID=889300 RepID=UPI002936C845|nr:DNA-binding protein [Nitratireductor aquimarinus]MDV2964653.1 DNA-binding protein [Nitratireductor aquimarinus]